MTSLEIINNMNNKELREAYIEFTNLLETPRQKHGEFSEALRKLIVSIGGNYYGDKLQGLEKLFHSVILSRFKEGNLQTNI